MFVMSHMTCSVHLRSVLERAPAEIAKYKSANVLNGWYVIGVALFDKNALCSLSVFFVSLLHTAVFLPPEADP